jgi:hypothetical protein
MRENTIKMSDEPGNEEFSAFLDRVTAHSRQINEARTLYSAFLKRAKNSGIPTKAGLIVQGLAKKGEDKAREFVADFVRFAAIAGYLSSEQLQQLALFDHSLPESALRERKLEIAAEAGWRAGLDGLPESDNQYSEGSEEAVVWQKWRLRGFDTREKADGEAGTQAVAHRAQPKGRRIKVAPVINPETGLPVKRPRGRPRKNSLSPPPVEVHIAA